jgi:glycosyltransferase involved in cell wall biosynthesis
MNERVQSDFPKISIITPSYNQGQFIERTILSVLEQDYPTIEYIIIDGGSTDNTMEILKKYEDRLIWKSEPDKGQSDAINKGFIMATGEIFAWLNSDDTYKAGAINTAVDYLVKHPRVDLIYGNGNLIDERDNLIGEFKSATVDLRACLYHGQISVFQPSVFFRKDVFEKIGALDEKLDITMDIDYWIRITRQGLTMEHIDCSLANLRWHQLAKTSKIMGQHRKYHLQLLRKHGVCPFVFYLLRHIILVYAKKLVFGNRRLFKKKKEGGQVLWNLQKGKNRK